MSERCPNACRSPKPLSTLCRRVRWPRCAAFRRAGGSVAFTIRFEGLSQNLTADRSTEGESRAELEADRVLHAVSAAVPHGGMADPSELVAQHKHDRAGVDAVPRVDPHTFRRQVETTPAHAPHGTRLLLPHQRRLALRPCHIRDPGVIGMESLEFRRPNRKTTLPVETGTDYNVLQG